ncbi:hypothetical protein SAMD00019534_050920, partial [Acytostelium subglobosum LB1]|uniref:hypothetical protein n=1 Tax=Acytostelium subglobosum LB1 TaxID=1410327 RepID=UPI00064493A9
MDIVQSSIPSEISPSYAMKINNTSINDQWADNIADFDNDDSIHGSPVTCSIGRPQILKQNTNCGEIPSPKTEYYNFNFRMGTPIAGKDIVGEATPTFSHG